jgi:hypothetical protein
MKASSFVCVFFNIGLSFAGPWESTTFTDEPRAPTTAEQQRFKARLDSLRAHSALHPHKLDEVVTSFTDSITLAFDCPETAKVRTVRIKITTRQIQWDEALIVNGKKIEIPHNTAGYYIWHPKIVIRKREKHFTADNLIMLDFSLSDRQAKNPLGPLADESVLYHEFLHGQLLIEAMSEKEWRDDACDCNLDLNAADGDHKRIPELVYAYLENLASLDERVYAVYIPPLAAKDDQGNFEVVLGKAGKTGRKQTWGSYYPERSNVDPASFDIRIKDKKIVAMGRLIDKNNKGIVLIHFVPQKEY